MEGAKAGGRDVGTGQSWHLRVLRKVCCRGYLTAPPHSLAPSIRQEDVLRDKKEREQMGKTHVHIRNDLAVVFSLGPPCPFDFLITQSKNNKIHPTGDSDGFIGKALS